VNQRTAFRGQPLLLLAALLAGWLGMRAAWWQPPFQADKAAAQIADVTDTDVRPVADVADASPTGLAAGEPLFERVPSPAPLHLERPLMPPLEPAPWSAPLGGFDLVLEPVPAPRVQASSRAVIGHNLLLIAGLAQMDVPPTLLAYLQQAQPAAPGVPAAAPMVAASVPRRAAMASRWSADGWVLLRKDSTTPILSGRPSYGRSQAGAVLRYNLALASPLRPQAYVRLSTALGGARERELAAGVSARPLASMPLRLAVEGRVGDTVFGRRIRPAAFAVTEFPTLRLPLGARAEAYAQGGYVGGEFATAFVDGQARAERTLARRGEAEISAGAGIWGGAQKGSARLDIGPTAAVSFRLGEARARVAADYRFRVAGDAEPSSGPALTLSAGF
jgi:hypothetical protein